MSFSLKQIRHFLAVADAGQISRAAVEHNISQSALTASIQQLEAILGGPLFERRSNGVMLTHAGLRFLPLARKVISSCNEALAVSGEIPRKVQGRLAIALTYTVAGYFLTPLLLRFRRIFPHVEFTLREAARSAIERDLIGGSGEIALLLTSNVTSDPRLASKTLFRSARRLWAPADHPLLQGERVGLADIAAYPYVALTVDEALNTASRYWDIAGHRPKILFETSSVEAVRSMVGAGLGVTILSDMVYRPWSIEAQRIDTRDIADPVPTMDVGVVWLRDEAMTPAARAFVDFMQGAFQATEEAVRIPSSA
ncbi:LysR family transcriptional regulator [Lichenifustis flavocetrariae]|uniref:LysR family transcriptional regulator n=1 Tax=Lichenifustis flavocetrariae TaxID=2949735 RepID=A0AA41YTI3_9HYPH|nr:LysR family transcriptional regulator [Lichenifustis flavocetrariae]MCW6508301.1 LysR family transcriptional regulator [Lichenifustis flavocetrariae]